MKTFSFPITLLMATIALLLSYPKASAATFNVTIAPNGNLVFSPSTVTIHPGDTVKWTWGSNFHSTTSGIPGDPTESGIPGFLPRELLSLIPSTVPALFRITAPHTVDAAAWWARSSWPILRRRRHLHRVQVDTDANTQTHAHTNTNTGVLPQFHDSRRVRRAQFSHHRRWKYSTWLAVALFGYHRQFQYRCWRWSAGPKQRRFQYRSGRCSVVAQHQRHTKHRHWN